MRLLLIPMVVGMMMSQCWRISHGFLSITSEVLLRRARSNHHQSSSVAIVRNRAINHQQQHRFLTLPTRIEADRGEGGGDGGGERRGRPKGSSNSKGGTGGNSSKKTRISRLSGSGSFSFNKAPRMPGAGSSKRDGPPPPSKDAPGEGSIKSPKEYGPISEDPGQHLIPKGLAPQDQFDIDARPNSRKARKAAAAAAASGGGAGGPSGTWERPSRIQQRREKKSQQLAEEKMRRLKIQRFAKEDLLGPSGLSQDVLQCDHFVSCSGCNFRAGLTETPTMEDARIFFRTQARVGTFNITMGDIHGWRTQAKLAVTRLSKWGGCRIGLYEEGSQRVAPIPNCRVHHPSINRAVQIIEKASEEMRTRAYDPLTNDGGLRYLQCAVERRTGRIQLTLVWNAAGRKEAGGEMSRLVKALKAADPEQELWHSIWINFRTGPGNAIFSRDSRSWLKVHGLDFLTEKVGPSQVLLYLTPMLFRQGNLDGFSRIVSRAQQFVPDGSTICELYGGVGVIGLNMLGKAKELRYSDINPFLQPAVDRTLEALSDKRRDKVSFMVATALEALEAGAGVGVGVLIVDPPRKGLEMEVLDHLKDKRDVLAGTINRLIYDKRDPLAGTIKRLIYVSCGFDAMKRDTTALLANGWKLIHAQGFVLFPGSDHLETLAIFDR